MQAKKLKLNQTKEHAQRIFDSITTKGLHLIVYGHAHMECVDYIGDLLAINPGSISAPRNRSTRKSYAIITNKDNKIVEKTYEEIIRYL